MDGRMETEAWVLGTLLKMIYCSSPCIDIKEHLHPLLCPFPFVYLANKFIFLSSRTRFTQWRIVGHNYYVRNSPCLNTFASAARRSYKWLNSVRRGTKNDSIETWRKWTGQSLPDLYIKAWIIPFGIFSLWNWQKLRERSHILSIF